MIEEKKWTQPDGTRREDYMLEGLSNEDIAFEVVRRSPKYQQMCKEVERGTVDAAQVAADVGMYRFKHFQEGRDDGYGRPRFKAATVSVYPHRKGKKFRRVPVSQDRIAIVVSLKEMSQSDKGETYLIEEVVAEKLKEHVERYRAMQGPPEPRRTKPEGVYRSNLEACLQVFDLDKNNVPDKEIFSKVKYLQDVTSARANDPNEAMRMRLRDTRTRNVKLFERLEIANILIHKG